MTARRALGLLVLAGVLAIVALEANVRAGGCPARVATGDLCGTLAPPVPPEEATRRRALLREARDAAALEARAADLAVAVPAAEMGAMNGLACRRGPVALVRDDLPPAADRYVRLHELWHLAHPEDDEAATNVAAARYRPWGMVRTVAFSVGRLFADRPVRCALASGWTAFKVYFTPFG